MDSKASLVSKDCNSILSPNSPLFQPIDTLTQTLLETNSCPYLPKLYGIYKSVEEIDFKALPDSFVLKTNHDCGGVVLVPDKEAFLADSESFNKAMEKLTKHLSINYATLYRERHYDGIEPRVFAEELLGGMKQGGVWEVPKDYKINQCGLQTLFVEIDSDRMNNHTRAMFDESFQPLPFQFSAENLPITYPLPSKPSAFSNLLTIAKLLGENISYVRVDLYEFDSKIHVGELTFTPAGGTSRFNPPEWDKKLGDLWQ